ncbi:MAG TPA: tetratricopeptide repeat protein [Candidatus Polarisedimenticolia bacterium]|nr:tetratricopeptide repeat protein [Candidatus Polarisedimenticolia bacterium]
MLWKTLQHPRPRLILAVWLSALPAAWGVVHAAEETSPRALMRYGVEAARGGLWREALARWERAVQTDAENPRLRNNLAVAYEAAGRTADAGRAYAEARKQFPESKEVRDNQESFLALHPELKEDIPGPVPPATKHKGKVARVTLFVPTPEHIDMTGLRHVLVTKMVIDEEPDELDLSKELVGVLRRDWRNRTSLDILDVEPPALPEQPIRDLLANTGFWRKLAERYEADLVVAGEAGFKTADRSGYVSVDEVSPMTGQRVRRTRFVTREAFLLDLHLFFLKGETGELLYEDHFSGEHTYDGAGFDRLSGLFMLYDEMAGDIRGIVSPGVRSLPRSLFEE